MTTRPSMDDLITGVERAVDATLQYFEGAGRQTNARIDRWGAWDVLAHFVYWHEATTWGIISASAGGPPWQLSAGPDQTNDTCLAMLAGQSFEALASRLRQTQERLTRAARHAPDLDAAALRRPDGETLTIAQRLETIARHWQSHLQELQVASAAFRA